MKIKKNHEQLADEIDNSAKFSIMIQISSWRNFEIRDRYGINKNKDSSDDQK